MKCTIGSDILDITAYPGKEMRLTTRIEGECYQRHLNNTLPYKIQMTIEQYDILKNRVEFGEKGESRYYKPEERIYCSKYNAMETIIKK
jgi:hypothetical protein